MGDELSISVGGIIMNEDDYDHFVGSVSEQLMLILWTSLATVSGVGLIMFLAIR
jgi:hypothetical protein